MVEILNVSTGRNFHTDMVLREHVISGKFAVVKDDASGVLYRMTGAGRVDAPVAKPSIPILR